MSVIAMANEIFTIGYSSFSLAEFQNTLKKHKITAIGDVRSLPYSQFKPEFNRENLEEELSKNDITYVFLGEECGARVAEPGCYTEGKVNFKLVAEHPLFKEGLARIKKGLKQFNIALMCAEKDPITCHRTILICRNLLPAKIAIKHILGDGRVELHSASEQRLMRLFDLHHPDMFRSEAQRLEDAYARQGEKIAYGNSDPVDYA